MEPLTPEQNNQLLSWASKRDSILLDIANKTTDRDHLIAINKDLASSNTEITDRIQQSIGRLEEINKKEEERATLIRADIVVLEAKKSILQTEISTHEFEIKTLLDKKESLNNDIATSIKIHESILSRSSDIERLIGETVTLNATNSREIANILVEAGNELQKVIDIGEKNITKTNAVILEIPKMIVDLHKDVLERKKIAKNRTI